MRKKSNLRDLIKLISNLRELLRNIERYSYSEINFSERYFRSLNLYFLINLSFYLFRISSISSYVALRIF